MAEIGGTLDVDKLIDSIMKVVLEKMEAEGYTPEQIEKVKKGLSESRKSEELNKENIIEKVI